MPRISKYLVPEARVSVTRRYLKKDRETARKMSTTFDLNLPGVKFFGYLIRKVNDKRPEQWEVRLDDISDHIAILSAGGLRFEGKIDNRVVNQADAARQIESEYLIAEDEINIESAEESEGEIEIAEENNSNNTWVICFQNYFIYILNLNFSFY